MREVWIPSPHYSTSRGPYNKIVLHTTEGAMKIRDLGAWFQNPSAGCSSHHGADNYEAGVFGAYVYESHKAWTQGNANSYCLSLEMCAYASWSRDTWLNSKGVLVNNAAEWVRYCVDKYNIPWTVLNNTQAQDPNARGICEHVNLGSWGSGHHDCGDGFPMDVVIDKAKSGSGGGTTPSSEDPMTSAVAFDSTGQAWFACIGDNHKVYVQGPGGGTSWKSVDPNSYAYGGVGIAVFGTDKIMITYLNKDKHVCSYYSTDKAKTFSWTLRGGDAM